MTIRALLRTVTFLVFLAIVGIAIIVLLPTFRAASPGRIGSTPGHGPEITKSFIPGSTQTVVAIITLKAIGEATYLATTRTPATPIFLPTGIYDDQRVKISGSLLFIDAQNAWGGIIDGYRFTLYAGALQSDPDQGLAYLVTEMPGGEAFEQFLTPSKHGAVSVVIEQNNRLTLIAIDGMIYYFDVPARRFVSSLTEVAPTVTLSPLVTRTPPYPPPPPPDFPYPFPTSPEAPVP